MVGRLGPLLIVPVLGAIAACKGHGADAPVAQADAGGETVAIPIAADGGGPADAPPMLSALASPTPVFSATEFPPKDPERATEDRKGVIRLGYLRKGARVAVKPSMIKKSSCAEGWYELIAGGFVCGKFATLDPDNKELANAPHPPLEDGPLPYQYGLNLTNGTPLYRRAPLRKERAEVEKALAIGKTKRNEKGEIERPAAAAGMTDANGEVPWYLRDHHGQRPQVTLDELRGESGLVVERMVRGFYLALDKEVKVFSGKFWRTTDGFLAPSDHILVHKTKTEFEGIHLDAAPPPGSDAGDAGGTSASAPAKLPIAWVLGLHTHKFTIDDGEERARRSAETLSRFTVLALTGKKKAIENQPYYETTDGFWVRGVDTTQARSTPPPPNLGPNEKWVDVNLTTQTLVAYEGEKPVFTTLISSGRHDDNDKTKDHRTVSGDFRIREKHVANTMDDDGASDGPYSIQDVPWIMYFSGSYALHGAFWHAQFGHERSHGCVNLQPIDAKTLFQWVGPRLPPGWHGVRATDENPGTRVIVHP